MVVPFGVGGSETLVRTIGEVGITAISCTPSYPAVLERVIAEKFPGLQAARSGPETRPVRRRGRGWTIPAFRARLEDVLGFRRAQRQLRRDGRVLQFRRPVRDQTAICISWPLDVLHPELIDPDSAAPRAWAKGPRANWC